MLLREIVKIHGKKIKAIKTDIDGVSADIGDINTNIGDMELSTGATDLTGAINETHNALQGLLDLQELLEANYGG
jgi:hypothetical protein